MREAGGRVATNVLGRDMDLTAPDLTDSRRLEVVVGGLTLFGGCQLVVDTTLVCALNCDGSPHGAAADADGVVLQSARRRKEHIYPPPFPRKADGARDGSGGRGSDETRSFVSYQARTRARHETAILQKRAEQAWDVLAYYVVLCNCKGDDDVALGPSLRTRF